MNFTYLLASVVAIFNPVFYEIKVHLRWYDAPVIWSHFQTNPSQEATHILLLLGQEVLEHVGEFRFLFNLEDLDLAIDLAHIVVKLDLPEAYPVVVLL